MTIKFLKQGDPAWSQQKLGTSKVSIGKSGCLLTVYSEILRTLGLDTSATPATTNKKAIKANAFVDAGIVQSTLASALGLNLGPLVVDEAALRTELAQVRETDTLFIGHVDHAGSRAGDHFILILLVDPARDLVVAADPATGLPCKLSLKTLIGPALWGNKTYRIRSVRCVTIRPASV